MMTSHRYGEPLQRRCGMARTTIVTEAAHLGSPNMRRQRSAASVKADSGAGR